MNDLNTFKRNWYVELVSRSNLVTFGLLNQHHVDTHVVLVENRSSISISDLTIGFFFATSVCYVRISFLR